MLKTVYNVLKLEFIAGSMNWYLYVANSLTNIFGRSIEPVDVHDFVPSLKNILKEQLVIPRILIRDVFKFEISDKESIHIRDCSRLGHIHNGRDNLPHAFGFFCPSIRHNRLQPLVRQGVMSCLNGVD